MNNEKIKEITNKATQQLIAALNPPSRWTLTNYLAAVVLEFQRRGVAQPGSAPALGAGGPRFESARPDQNSQ